MQFQEFETIEDGLSRVYVIGEKKLLSVTSFLSLTSDKTFLEQWRARVGEAEANRISKQATTRGRDLHSLCEAQVKGLPYPSDVEPAAKSMFKHVKPVLEKSVDCVVGSEVILYSAEVGLAGRTDLIASFNGKPSIIDFKSNHKDQLKKDSHIGDYKLQLFIYSLLFEKMTGLKIKNGVLIIASLFGRQIVEFDCRSVELENEFYTRLKLING